MPDLFPTPGTLTHVHETHLSMSVIELSPPHDPREDTPIYRATHARLVIKEDRPCFICAVRYSDLRDPVRRNDLAINPMQAVTQETHHWPIERSLASAIDGDLLAKDYPSVLQYKTLIEWIDSEFNMLVLCSTCHRGETGVHHVAAQDFFAAKYAIKGADGASYQFAATVADAATVEAKDEAIAQAAGLEPTPTAAQKVEA